MDDWPFALKVWGGLIALTVLVSLSGSRVLLTIYVVVVLVGLVLAAIFGGGGGGSSDGGRDGANQ